MASILNTASGGAVGATVTTANSGGASGVAFDFIDVTGTLVYSANQAHGINSVNSAGTGTRSAFGWAGAAVIPSKLQSFRAYLRVGLMPTLETQIVTPWNSAQYIAGVNLGSDGKLRVTARGGALLYTTTTVLALNTWYRVEFSVEVGTTASNGVIRFGLYSMDSTTALETVFTSSTVDLGTTNVISWRMGKISTSGNADMLWDSIEVNMDSSALLGPFIASVPVIRPSTIISNPGNWSNVGGAASIPAALADELDSTYAQTVAAPASAQITLGMNGRLGSGTPTVLVRLLASAVTPAAYADVALMQGNVVIATRNFGPLSTSATDYSFTLTTGEAAAITDRSDLRLRVTGNQP